jgi:hypothetical protein
MLALGGCAAQREFAGYTVRESPSVAAAPWPRLVDGPNHAEPPGPGPDTVAGALIATELTEAARVQAAEAARLAAPVFAVGPLREEAETVRAGRP